MTRLASQPTTPPTISQMMIPISIPSCFVTATTLGGLPASRRAMRARCSGFGRVCPAFRWMPRCAWARQMRGSIERWNERARLSGSITLLALVLVAVLLDAGDAQAGHAAAVDRALPAGEFLEAERITLARLVHRQEPAGDGGHHLGLAANHPAAGRGRRK